MKERKKGRKSPRRLISLNLILWLSFLVFAIVLIVMNTLVFNFQLNRQYRDHVSENLKTATARLKTQLNDQSGASFEQLSRILLNTANEYGVSVYLISPEKKFVYPSSLSDVSGTEAEKYLRIIDAVCEKFENAREDKNLVFSISSEEFAGYATLVELWGMNHYLYLGNSYELLNGMVRDMTWLSLITALFAVALAFVGSGFVSMVITKPVTEVTERAKALARGSYDSGFEGSYFCTEVNELSEALDYARTEIGKADKMQKELIANVSHDFKTPLTMIKAYAAMIGEISGDDPEKRNKHVGVIIEETDRLAALVEDVLDLSKLQAGQGGEDRAVFNLSEDVYRVAGRFGYLTETQGYSLETDIEDDLYTYAGRRRVEQVLYNLIGNAFNYTGEDKRVSVTLKKAEGCAHFEVTDSGKGIPPEEIDSIWERYYRSSSTHKRPVQGSGLGLSIVKNVLLKYGIPFGVRSEQGKGSTFWVDFPDPPAETSEIK